MTNPPCFRVTAASGSVATESAALLRDDPDLAPLLAEREPPVLRLPFPDDRPLPLDTERTERRRTTRRWFCHGVTPLPENARSKRWRR